jgi:integrase
MLAYETDSAIPEGTATAKAPEAIRENWRTRRRIGSPRHRCLPAFEEEGIAMKSSAKQQVVTGRVEIPEGPREERAANPAVIPFAAKKARPVRAKRSQMTFLTPEEVLTLLKVARERSTRDWAMILLAYRHGLRASEVCGVKLADIDLKTGSISVRRLKGSPQTIQPLYQHRGQPLLDETAALRVWLRKRPKDGSDYLFTSQKGGKLDRTQFFRAFRTVGRLAGLPIEKQHPHVLTHSLASHLVAGNVNLALVRQALGHRSINSTMQYVGTSDRQASEAAQAALMNLF